MALYTKEAVAKRVSLGQIKPEELPGLEFEGKVVVLQGQSGKPTKMARHKKRWFSETQKVEAATVFAATGNVKTTSLLTKIPEGTIRNWKDEDWWLVLQSRVRRENNEQTDAKLTSIIDKTLDKIGENIDQGNVVYDSKTGTMKRVPLNARDLAIITNSTFDKRQLLRGEATKITKAVNAEDHLDRLAEKFMEAVKKKVGMKNETMDAEFTEVKDV